MPALYVDRLRCLQDSPEWTPDELYLVVVAVATRGAPDLQVVCIGDAERWRGLAAGGDRPVDVLVDPAWNTDRFYVLALLEQDGARDFADPPRRRRARERLDEIYRTFASVHRVTIDEIADALQAELARCLRELRDDDDTIGPVRILRPGHRDSSMAFELAGPRGRYSLAFKLA